MSYDASVFHAVRKVSVRARDAIQTGFIVQLWQMWNNLLSSSLA